jgi:predicted PurR-regulated permease PerM
MNETRFRRAFLLLLVAAISFAFIAMVWEFVLTILLAATFTGLSYPLYLQLLAGLRNRALSAIMTLVLVLVLGLAPLLGVLAVGANEALRITETVGPRLTQIVSEPTAVDAQLQRLPGYSYVEPYREQILTKLGELVGEASKLVFDVLSATTRATALFVFHTGVLLYAMYFFLTGGPSLLRYVMAYVPLADVDKQRMIEKFVSVTRATLKGTLLIGGAQGMLGGLAFWVVGIEGPVFWGMVMTVLSIIPGIGGALVWVPAAIVLVVTGEVWKGIGLAAFCGLAVGSVDNLLRPIVVGRDTQLHELLIFLSTLGGLMFFGASGFILGPVLAALFVTVWEIFAIAFRRELAEPTSIITDPSAPSPLPSAIITDTSAGSPSLSTSPRPATPS